MPSFKDDDRRRQSPARQRILDAGEAPAHLLQQPRAL